MIKRFNSGAVWLPTGVSGTVVFAAVVLAVQDHYARKANCTKVVVPAVDVKARLIALWHQSLIRGERSRSWPLSANLKGARKKISYTAEIKNYGE